MDGTSQVADVLAHFGIDWVSTVPKDSPRDPTKAEYFDAVLAHFGIKGMRWGQKKARPVSADSKAKTAIKDKAKKDRVAAVSNVQLQTAIRRMQLEQDFKRLAVNEKPAITRWLSSTLLEIGKREVQAAAAKKITALVAKKVVTGGAA